MPWLRQLLDWQNEVEDPGEFLDSLRFEINSAEVFVFTPRGDVIGLPTGSTPVDFAYADPHRGRAPHDRRPGQRPAGAAGVRRSSNGDVVEVFTSKSPNAGPTRDWLTFVKSPRARSKIRHWFTKERREEAIEQGKEQIGRLLRKEGLPAQARDDPRVADPGRQRAPARPTCPRSTRRWARATSAPRPSYARSSRSPAATTAPRRTSPRPSRSPGRDGAARTAGSDSGVVVKGATDVLVKLARCCTPVPGDEILGFVTRGDGVSVHRTRLHQRHRTCSSQPERLAEVEWAPTSQSTFLVQIMVEALDRARLLSDITMALSDQHVNILSASA